MPYLFCLGYQIDLLDVDEILDSLSVTPGGFRAFVATKAAELRLTGFVRRTRFPDAEVHLEGTHDDIFALIAILRSMRHIGYLKLRSRCQVIASMRFYGDFRILRNTTRTSFSEHSTSEP